MDGLLIRPATLADALAIAQLCEPLGYPTDLKDLLPRLEDILAKPDEMVFLAAEPNGQVIGWVHAARVTHLESAPFAEIGGIVVDPLSRRNGAGRHLMAAVEAWARECGLREVRLRSNVTREEAHVFYRMSGYQQIKAQYTFVKAV